MKDMVTFFLCLMAALCAECIPLLFLLTVAAVVASFWPERRKQGGKDGMNQRQYGARTAGRYFRECPRCGAHLDPGEVCDCGGQKESRPGATNTRAAIAEKATVKRLYPALILGHTVGGCQG